MENTQPHSHETDIDIMQPLSPEMEKRVNACYKKLIDDMPEDPMQRLIPKNIDKCLSDHTDSAKKTERILASIDILMSNPKKVKKMHDAVRAQISEYVKKHPNIMQ